MNKNSKRVKRLRAEIARLKTEIGILLEGGPDAEALKALYDFKFRVKSACMFGDASVGNKKTSGIYGQFESFSHDDNWFIVGALDKPNLTLPHHEGLEGS